MPNVELLPPQRPSMWRKMASAIWGSPHDPTIYARLEVDMARALEFADQLGRHRGVRIAPVHLVARATALALRKHPDANAMVRFRRVRLRTCVNLFFQVAVPGKTIDLTGVLIRDADKKDPAEIADELRRRAAAARRGQDDEFSAGRRGLDRIPRWLFPATLKCLDFFQYTLNANPRVLGIPRDAFGGVMITSVGSLGMAEAFAPLVPRTRTPLVVAVGKVEDKPVVRQGAVTVRPMCVLGATLDHRVFDGLLASRVAKSVVRYLADPARFERDFLGSIGSSFGNRP